MKIENIEKAVELIDNRNELLKIKNRILEQEEMSINGYRVSIVFRDKARKVAIEFIDKEIQQTENQIRNLK